MSFWDYVAFNGHLIISGYEQNAFFFFFFLEWYLMLKSAQDFEILKEKSKYTEFEGMIYNLI